jgi:hypothetical protein
MKHRSNDIAPQARSDTFAVSVGSKMYLFGGSSLEVTPLNDLW